MLNTFRKNKHSVLGTMIIAVCAVMMFGFGVNVFNQNSNSQVAIKIGKHEISFIEYRQAYQNISNNFQQQYGENFEMLRGMLKLEERTTDALIADYLANKLIADLNLQVSPQQIVTDVASNDFFKTTGYNKDAYQSFLRSTGLSGKRLEEITRDSLQRKQLSSLIEDLAVITDAEIVPAFNLQNSKASFQYLTVSSEDFKSKVKTDDEKELEKFYEEEKERYRKPDMVQYSFVAFSPEEYQSEVEIVEEDLQDLYQEQKYKFVTEKEVKLRQIVLKKKTNEEEKKNAEALEKFLKLDKKKSKKKIDPNLVVKNNAEDILKKLEEGENFSNLAKKLSEDEATKEAGGELPWQTLASLPTNAASAIDKLEPQENSGIVEDDSSFYIYFLEEKKDPRTKEFEEVRGELEAQIKTSDSPIYASAAAEKFRSEFENINGDISFADFVKKQNKTLVSTEKLIDSAENIKDIPLELTPSVLKLEKGDIKEVPLNNNLYVVYVDNKKDSFIPKYEEVKTELTKDYVEATSKTLAKEYADKLLKDIAEDFAKSKDVNKSLTELAKKDKLEIKSTEPAKLAEAKGEIFSSMEDNNQLFNLETSQPIAKDVLGSSEKYYVVTLKEKELPDSKTFAQEKTKLIEEESNNYQRRIYAALISALKAEKDNTVWINPDLKINGSI